MFYINDHLTEGHPTPWQKRMMANINKDSPVIYQYTKRRMGASTVINNFISENLLRGYRIIHINTDYYRHVPYATVVHGINFGKNLRTGRLGGFNTNSLYGLNIDIGILEDVIMTSEVMYAIEALKRCTTKLIITTNDSRYAPKNDQKSYYYNTSYAGNW